MSKKRTLCDNPHYYKKELPPLLKKTIQNTSFLTLLDCGCGDGTLLYYLEKNHLIHGKDINAVDISEDRVSEAKNISSAIKVRVDNAEELKTVPNRSIDLLVSSQVIEHLDDSLMINAIARVVRQGGLAYISTVFKKPYAWYFYRNGGQWVIDPSHIREYACKSQLLDKFDAEHFTVLEESMQLIRFPLSDILARLAGVKDRHVQQRGLFSLLQNIKIPIPGYFYWEVLLRVT